MKQGRRAVLGTLLSMAGAATAPEIGAGEPVFKAGAAAVDITPSLERPVYLAGYSANRRAVEVHDPVWARALVFEYGAFRTALVACDLIGLLHDRISIIREGVSAVPPAHLLVGCTHVHSGPDTLGLWGPGPLASGLDPVYMETLTVKIRRAISEAAGRLAPARLSAGRVQPPPGLVHNSREPVQDHDLTALRLTAEDGSTIATVIHYGGHPEVIKDEPAITSDYVHHLRQVVEKKYGGTALYLNGALGGMVTPDVGDRHTWAEMERVGAGLGRAALQALEGARPIKVARLAMVSTPAQLSVTNQRLQLAAHAGLLDLQNRRLDTASTEICRMDLGEVTMLSVPGEILPAPALQLKAEMPGPFPMVVALGNDELGYILDPKDWERELYSYERSMSIGPEAWPQIQKAARSLLGRPES